ncbi:cytochrome d ubiquinol oxidase subunit II [Sphingobacterium sp. SG20118]|uniref:cytochrome d ubiquinol oxidase subunit II n=1 Tax=Sphingobacterium sp. SG20118 TaxID=3367156 RepID=UPI0037DFC510
MAVVTLTIHGANWIILKTASTLNQRLKGFIFKLNFILLFLVLLSAYVWHYVKPISLHNFESNYWLWVFPFIAAVGLFGLFRIEKFQKDISGFVFSSLFIFGSFGSTIASMFPILLPSTNNINPSLTVQNMAAHEYGLSVGVGWFAVAAVLVIIYFIIQFKVFKGKLDDVGYGDH